MYLQNKSNVFVAVEVHQIFGLEAGFMVQSSY